MFRGRYEHSIDEKGRISIPARFREILKAKNAECLVITTYDGCLYAYSFDEWKVLEEKAAAAPMITPEDKAFMRLFFSGAMEILLDKTGRILLPPNYRGYAGIQKEVVFAGMLTRFEIWSKERFEERVFSSAEGKGVLAQSEMASRLGI